MATQDKSKLLALAKSHLGYSTNDPDEVVPSAYLDELLEHTLLYPYYINFRLTLEPGTGFGQVTCLEQDCNNPIIYLDRHSSFPDGGLRDGLGSLSAYRDHMYATHAEYQHDKQRAVGVLGSVIDYAISAYPPDVKMEQSCLPSIIDNSYGSPLNRHRAAQRPEIVNEYPRVECDPAQTKESSLMCINAQPAAFSGDIATTTSMWNVSSFIPAAEATEALLPRKRSSDAASDANELAQIRQVSPDIKRRKLEEIPANFNIPGFPLVNHVTPSNVDAIPANICVIQDEIITDENVLNSPRYKKRPKVENIMENAPTSLWRHKDNFNTSLESVPAVKGSLSGFHVSALQEDAGSAAAPPTFFQYQVVLDQVPVASGSSVSLPLPVVYDNIEGDDQVNHYEYKDDLEGDDYMAVNHYEYNDDLACGVLQRISSGIPEITPFQGYGYFEESGDYYGRGCDTFAGPQAKADDIDKFLIEAGNAQQFDGNAKLEQALEKLGLQSQYDLLPGMEVPLMPHQTIGVAWMIEKEKSRLSGGCLADDMGLGKTVQMIATLVKNRSKDPMCKTTLIIAPFALLDQWKLEIELKASRNLRCLIYHGSTKPKRKQDLLSYDVILTTYSTMALEWPDHENETKKQAKAKAKKRDDFIVNDSEDEKVRPKKKQEQGLLFQVEFFRIVLDEAQSIRNRRTRTSRAVTDLQATYRWCLTGTPIINSLIDVYGYLRFLRVRPWYDWEEFQRHIGSLEKRRPTLAVSRLQTIIATFLLRRMKDTTMDGKRLIELPERKVSLVRLQFSNEERDIYKTVEAGAQANFNRFLKAGTVLKNYTQVLVLLLRLRQICSHPSLVQEGGAFFISNNPVDDDESSIENELSRARRLVSSEFVAIMKAKLKASSVQRMEAEKQSADATAEDEECPICFDAFTDAVVTPCTHVFCRECIVDVLNTPLAVNPNEPNRYKANERPCPTCRGAFCAEKLFLRRAFLPSDAELLSDDDIKVKDDDAVSNNKIKDRGKVRPGRSCKIIYSDSDEDATNFIVENDDDGDEKSTPRFLKCLGHRKPLVVLDSDDEETPEEKEVIFGLGIPRSIEAIQPMPKFLPSTKMKYMMEQLSRLLEDRPDEKTLVVSQWTACLSLVSDYLTEKGVIHVKYQGDMNRVKRNQAIRVFMSRDKARVMLISLKCGGVGLNLTRANNVISLDLGWSQAIEAQSFDRVHRLGQTRPVNIQRLVISNTVEDRVLAMQDRKQQLADGSLGEGSGKKIGRLTVKELANLFGLDHRGRLLQNEN